VIKENALTAGYNNIIVLPVGATSIKIEENRPTSNSLGNFRFYYIKIFALFCLFIFSLQAFRIDCLLKAVIG
jgi:hypothetical protein